MTDLLSIATTWHDDGPGGWWFVFPLFWILVIGTMIFMFRTGRWGPRRYATTRESAVEVLDRRFAEGELSLEDYRERRAILTEEQADG